LWKICAGTWTPGFCQPTLKILRENDPVSHGKILRQRQIPNFAVCHPIRGSQLPHIHRLVKPALHAGRLKIFSRGHDAASGSPSIAFSRRRVIHCESEILFLAAWRNAARFTRAGMVNVVFSALDLLRTTRGIRLKYVWYTCGQHIFLIFFDFFLLGIFKRILMKW
jgi:hypothetical protein